MEEGMMITVEGEELLPEEFSAEYGWRSVAIKKSAGRGRPGDRPRAESGGSGHEAEHSRRAQGARNKIIKASRMPPLPKEHFRIIFRPRGGLDVRKTGPIRLGQAIFTAAGLGLEEVIQDIICPNTMQNIIVASTPSRVNADAYLKVELITIGESQHEVSTYEAAPHATCKGVIRNVDIGQSQADLDRNIINSRNPLALAVKRIKNTETVVIAFDGYKVPNFVRYGPSLVKCSLYLRQHDNCYACGRLGHRADVCPTPENVICRGCGVNNTDSTHACTPKCGLCGGQHPTADKSCKHRFQVPYVVRLRRRERAQAARKDDATPKSSTRRSRSRRRSVTRGERFSRSRSLEEP
ncbi:hypothetical protein MTO96_002846 [Rhipicephalus appendiculatus]